MLRSIILLAVVLTVCFGLPVEDDHRNDEMHEHQNRPDNILEGARMDSTLAILGAARRNALEDLESSIDAKAKAATTRVHKAVTCNTELAAARGKLNLQKNLNHQLTQMIRALQNILRSHTNAAGVEDAEISDSMSIKGKTSQQWGHRHHLHRRHDPHTVCQAALTAERGKLNLQKNLNHQLTQKIRALQNTLRSHTNAAGVEDAEISDSMSIKGKTSQQWGHRDRPFRNHRHDPHAAPTKAPMVSFGTTNRASGTNNWDGTYKFDCPANQAITKLTSSHSNHFEDRKWQFTCNAIVNQGGSVTLSNDRWGGFNGWDGTQNQACGTNEVMTGIWSEHSNGKEDRRYKIKCSRINGATINYLQQWSQWANGWDGNLDYTCQQGLAMTAMYSQHSNGKEDRRFKFKCGQAQ